MAEEKNDFAKEGDGMSDMSVPYGELAALARTTRATFGTLVKRYEGGSRDDALAGRIRPGKNWITTEDAAKAMCCSICTATKYPEIAGAIRRKSRSLTDKQPQGVGALWYLPDIKEVMRIKRVCRSSLRQAAITLKEFRAGRLFPKPEEK